MPSRRSIRSCQVSCSSCAVSAAGSPTWVASWSRLTERWPTWVSLIVAQATRAAFCLSPMISPRTLVACGTLRFWRGVGPAGCQQGVTDPAFGWLAGKAMLMAVQPAGQRGHPGRGAGGLDVATVDPDRRGAGEAGTLGGCLVADQAAAQLGVDAQLRADPLHQRQRPSVVGTVADVEHLDQRTMARLPGDHHTPPWLNGAPGGQRARTGLGGLPSVRNPASAAVERAAARAGRPGALDAADEWVPSGGWGEG